MSSHVSVGREDSTPLSQSFSFHSPLKVTSSSPEKYKHIVRHLVSYTNVLTHLFKLKHNGEIDEEKKSSSRRKLLIVLQRIEKELSAFYSSPSTNQEESLSAILNDLKRQVLCSVSSPKKEADREAKMRNHLNIQNTTEEEEGDEEAVTCFSTIKDESLPSSGSGPAKEINIGNVINCSAREEAVAVTAENDEEDEEEDSSVVKRVKRLNKTSTKFLTSWLLDHLESPFPSWEEKQQLAKTLHLEVSQVGNWMTNMRKRHVYPILSGKKPAKSPLELEILGRQQQQRHRSRRLQRASSSWTPSRADRLLEAWHSKSSRQDHPVEEMQANTNSSSLQWMNSNPNGQLTTTSSSCSDLCDEGLVEEMRAQKRQRESSGSGSCSGEEEALKRSRAEDPWLAWLGREEESVGRCLSGDSHFSSSLALDALQDVTADEDRVFRDMCALWNCQEQSEEAEVTELQTI